jgi:N-methylhydantoinase A
LCSGTSATGPRYGQPNTASRRAAGTKRRAYFGPEAGWIETPVLARADLSVPRQGPVIVEEYDATSVVPPGTTARLDGYGNIVVEVG